MSNNKSNFYFLLTVSFLAFLGGLYYPLFTASGAVLGFEISQEQVTFLESIKILERQQYKELAMLLYAFVIILPAIKFFTILLNINGIKVFSSKFNDFLLSLQKYAMVDVFVISLIAIASKSNPMFSIKLEVGTYALIASVVSGIILSLWIMSDSKYSQAKKKIEY